MRVQAHPKDYQSVALIGCYDFICHPLRARLTMTEVTVFSCLLSTHFTSARLTRPTKCCLCLPRTTAHHCWDAPKSFIYEHCDIAAVCNLQTFHFPLFPPKLCSDGGTAIAFVAWQRQLIEHFIRKY